MADRSWLDVPPRSTWSLPVTLYGTATVLTSVGLYVAWSTDRAPIQVLVSGIFLLGFFGQAVAVLSGSPRESRTMFGGTLAALVIVLGMLVVWPFGPSLQRAGVENVARGLVVACVLTALGYLGHHVGRGWW